jgi:hypothetical protein
MAENPHYRELLRLLNEFEVQYLIVGGYAMSRPHGSWPDVPPDIRYSTLPAIPRTTALRR